jgi:uncharacterized cupredoxin-like copper-binding protein
MTIHKHIGLVFAAALAVGCGGSGGTAALRVGAGGAAIQTESGHRIDIPRGALQGEMEIQVTESKSSRGEPELEIEPSETQLEKSATITFKSDDPAELEAEHVTEVENEVEHQAEVETHDRAEHTVSAEVKHFGKFRLSRSGAGQGGHGADDQPPAPAASPAPPPACTPACGAGFHCDGGVCKPERIG